MNEPRVEKRPRVSNQSGQLPQCTATVNESSPGLTNPAHHTDSLIPLKRKKESYERLIQNQK